MAAGPITAGIPSPNTLFSTNANYTVVKFGTFGSNEKYTAPAKLELLHREKH